MSWLFFGAEEGREYDQGSLEAHLDYLREWGGSPDMWDSFEGPIRKAFEEAENSGLVLAVVEEGSYEIFGVVNND